MVIFVIGYRYRLIRSIMYNRDLLSAVFFFWALLVRFFTISSNKYETLYFMTGNLIAIKLSQPAGHMLLACGSTLKAGDLNGPDSWSIINFTGRDCTWVNNSTDYMMGGCVMERQREPSIYKKISNIRRSGCTPRLLCWFVKKSRAGTQYAVPYSKNQYLFETKRTRKKDVRPGNEWDFGFAKTWRLEHGAWASRALWVEKRIGSALERARAIKLIFLVRFTPNVASVWSSQHLHFTRVISAPTYLLAARAACWPVQWEQGL